jgi:hypothetical protein
MALSVQTGDSKYQRAVDEMRSAAAATAAILHFRLATQNLPFAERTLITRRHCPGQAFRTTSARFCLLSEM